MNFRGYIQHKEIFCSLAFIFIYVYECFAPYVCVHIHAVPMENRRGYWIPRIKVTNRSELPYGCWELNPDSGGITSALNFWAISPAPMVCCFKCTLTQNCLSHVSYESEVRNEGSSNPSPSRNLNWGVFHHMDAGTVFTAFVLGEASR